MGRHWPLILALLLTLTHPSHAQTLDRVRETKTLRCAINQETPEYSTSDDHGPRQAFDADLCRAVAIAILGPTAKVVAIPYPDDVATMEALRSGQVDLIPTLTLDLTHAANPALAFTPPVLYDSVGLLVPLAAHLSRAAQLDGKKICFLVETEVEVALRAWFAQSQPTQQHLYFVPFPFQEEGEMEAAFITGNCTALAGDRTRLAGTRLAFGPLAASYSLLPDQISQDPLAAASRAGDPAFAAIVRWTFEVLLNAEALGLTQQTIAAASAPGRAPAPAPPAPSSELSFRPDPEPAEGEVEKPATSPASPAANPTIAVLSGQTREIGARLSLDDAWATQVIAAVGNYGEIYARDLGDLSPLKIPRALNRLYTEGGLMYPIPLK